MTAVLLGVGLAVAWTLLVAFTHNPVSLGAWGVGGLIGIVLGRAGRRGETASASRGTLAIVLTVGTVLLAKAMILVFALRPIVRDELVRSPEARTALFMIDMSVHRSFSPDLQAELDKEKAAGRILAARRSSSCGGSSSANDCSPRPKPVIRRQRPPSASESCGPMRTACSGASRSCRCWAGYSDCGISCG